MYQQITIIGNVGRDPEMRYTQGGVAVCDFSVAVNKRYTTAGGEQRDETTTGRARAVVERLERGGRAVRSACRVRKVRPHPGLHSSGSQTTADPPSWRSETQACSGRSPNLHCARRECRRQPGRVPVRTRTCARDRDAKSPWAKARVVRDSLLPVVVPSGSRAPLCPCMGHRKMLFPNVLP